MLVLEAIIRFDTPNENSNALSNDLSTSGVLRPAINFGNDLLFSGTLLTDKRDSVLIRGEEYQLLIEMPTVEGEVYNSIRHLIKVNNNFKLQLASRVIGQGLIIDFEYS